MSTLLAPRSVARSVSAQEADSIPAAFAQQLKELAQLTRQSSHLYSSPLGPFRHNARQFPLPHFTYFGASTADESPRLSFLAGFDSRDLHGTHALLHLVRLLTLQPEIAQGLHLAFFPLVDVLGLSGESPHRDLARTSWRTPATPELELLSQDALLYGYQGFIRLESTTDDDVVSIHARGLDAFSPADPREAILSSEDVAPFTVRWEAAPSGKPQDGPLSLGNDLPHEAFELTLRIPHSWSPELYREAATTILKRFIRRYRTFLAHAQHL
jgi:hypothetical protein